MNRYLATSPRFALISLVAICALDGSGRASAADRSALSLAAASITKEELKQHVDVLADDTLEGREAGSRGGRAAGNYLLKAFETKGLSPLATPEPTFSHSAALHGISWASCPAAIRSSHSK